MKLQNYIIMYTILLVYIGMVQAVYSDYFLPLGENELENCISSIIDNFQRGKSLLLKITTHKLVDKIAKAMASRPYELINMKAANHTLLLNSLQSFYCIIYDDVKKMELFFNTLYDSWRFNPQAKYFIIHTGIGSLHKLFKVMSVAFLQNVIVLDLFGRFYKPVDYQKYCGLKPEQEYLFTCPNVELTTVQRIFKKTVTNFVGCNVKILAVIKPPYVVNPHDPKMPGIEAMLYRFAAKKYNFTPVYLPDLGLPWGQKLPDGTFNRMVSRLNNREGDIMFGNFRLNQTFMYDFLGTAAYLENSLAFYVPAAEMEDNLTIIRVFSKLVWALICVSLVLSMFAFLFTARIVKMVKGQTYKFEAIYTVGMLLSQPVTQRTNLLIVRYLFILWILFSYVFTSSFVATFLTFFVKPIEKSQFNSFEDIRKSGMRFGGLRYAKDLFAEQNTSIYNEWIDCPLNLTCMLESAFEGNLATMDSVAYYRYYLHLFLHETTGRSRLHQLPASITYYSWTIMQKGFPLFSPVNSIIPRLTEHGYFQKWVNDYTAISPKYPSEVYVPIKIVHILVVIYAYIGGVLLSIVVFIYQYVKFQMEHKEELEYVI